MIPSTMSFSSLILKGLAHFLPHMCTSFLLISYFIPALRGVHYVLENVIRLINLEKWDDLVNS